LKVKNIAWLVISVIVVGLDQLTKHWAIGYLSLGKPHKITSFFNLALAYNQGIAFSIFDDPTHMIRWLLVTVIVAISLLLLGVILRMPKARFWNSLAISFVLGGAIGNLWDRIQLGYVVDFLQFHYQKNYWPTFNLGDTFIVVGAVMIILSILFKPDDWRG